MKAARENAFAREICRPKVDYLQNWSEKFAWTRRFSPLRHALLKSLKIADELNTVSRSGLVISWQLCMSSQSTTEVLATLAWHRHTQFIISQYCTVVPVAVPVYSIVAHHVKRITEHGCALPIASQVPKFLNVLESCAINLFFCQKKFRSSLISIRDDHMATHIPTNGRTHQAIVSLQDTCISFL